MRDTEYLMGWLPALALAFIVFAAVLLSSSDAFASDVGLKPTVSPTTADGAGIKASQLPDTHLRSEPGRLFLTLRPSISSTLTSTDRLAALESIQTALSQVADGSTYFWKRRNGRLTALIRPKKSFQNGKGQVCRDLVVILKSSHRRRSTEATACRSGGGIWQFQG